MITFSSANKAITSLRKEGATHAKHYTKHWMVYRHRSGQCAEIVVWQWMPGRWVVGPFGDGQHSWNLCTLPMPKDAIPIGRKPRRR